MYTQCKQWCNDPFEQKNSPFDQQWECGAMTREECRPSASKGAPFEQWKLGAMTREECPI